MKHILLFVAGLFAATPFAVTAAHADTVFVPAQSETEYLAKDHLIGAKVHGAEGTIIGDVEDLIVNDENQVVGVVMGTGGYFGWAEKKVGIGLASLKFEEKDGTLYVSLPDVTKEALETAPAFQRKKPPKSLFERAKEKVDELSDKTKSSTESAIEAAKPAIEDAKRRAQEALDKAKEAAGPALDKAKEAVSGAIDAAKETVNEATKSDEPAPDAPATPPADSTPPAEPTPSP